MEAATDRGAPGTCEERGGGVIQSEDEVGVRSRCHRSFWATEYTGGYYLHHL